jgi:hypothetical protein
MMEKYQRSPYNRNVKEVGREKDQKKDGEDRLSKKRGEVGINLGLWQLIDRSGKNS